jgi:Wiskott-Aldrich syndrome protein
MDIDKYDDYVAGPVREVITVDTKIKNTNRGFKMLSKLGWVEGQCLGLTQDGVPSPLNHPAETV